MRWEDERYVRSYTRDTLEWLALGWEAHALFWELLRKADRAGILQLGKAGHVGISVATGIPLDVVERSLPALLRDGCVTENGTTLVIKNYIDAQEAKASDKQRQREHRAKARDLALSQNVTGHTGTVTERDEKSRAVTRGHADLISVTPSRTEPSCLSPGSSLPFSASDPKSKPHARPSGLDLTTAFGQERAKVWENCLPWTTAQNRDGGAESFAAALPADVEMPEVLATMLAFFAHVKAGHDGWNDQRNAKDPSFAFGTWKAKFTALREELRGCAPETATPANKFSTPPDWRKHLVPNGSR